MTTGEAPAHPLAQVEQELLARWPEARIDPTLERIARLTELLGTPQRRFRSVHLTGTNGKTSTARMVEALLGGSGLRTGRLTSPHLTSICERISLDGRPIDDDGMLRCYEQVVRQARRVDADSAVPVSFFEMTVAMAYLAFAQHGVEAAVVEVGMGGRWDATNVIDAEVAAILPVELDHTDYLGATVAAIATEKAGIVKQGATAVSARQSAEVARILRDRAREVGASLAEEGRDFAVTSRVPSASGQVISIAGLHGRYDAVPLSLHGEHQAQNAAVALASVEALAGGPVDPAVVSTVLGSVASPGRFQVVAGSPEVVLDAAHNPHGARALARSVRERHAGPVVLVLGVMGDKDHEAVLRELAPCADHVVCVRSSSPRGLPAEELALVARRVLGPGRVDVADGVSDGLAVARRLLASREGLDGGSVVVTGSVVTVADAAQLLAPAAALGAPGR